MKRLAPRAVALFVWLYCLAAVFDPSDSIIGAKRLLFAILMSLFLAELALGNVSVTKSLLIRASAVAFAIPAIWLAVYMHHHPGNGAAEGLALAKALLPALLVFPLAASGVDLRKPLFTSLVLLAAFTAAMAVGSAADPIPQRAIAEYLTAKSAALVGMRFFGRLSMAMIFFVASPLLVLPVPYLVFGLFRRKTPTARAGAAAVLALVLGAAFLSASRALFLTMILEMAVCGVWAMRNRYAILAMTVTLALVCALAATLLARKTAVLSLTERSNSVKIGHLRSFISHVAENPSVLLTGDGLGARYYSDAPGVEGEVSQTELTFLDMVRYFGLGGTLLLLLLLAYPRGVGDLRPIAGFAAYLLLAGSNPLLFNSTGMLAVCFYWASQEVRNIKGSVLRVAPESAPGDREVAVAPHP